MGNYISNLFSKEAEDSNTPDSSASENEIASGGVTSLEEIKTTDTDVNNKALDKVKAGLYSVKVSQIDATQAQREMEGELFKKWEEGCEVMEARQIPIKNIPDFLNHLQEAYEGIDEKMRKKMDGIKWAGEWCHRIVEMEYTVSDDSSARYGMIAFGKSKDERFVDCMYCLYKLDFEIAPDTIVTKKDKSILWGLVNWQSVKQDEREHVLGLQTLKRIKNLFRYKALQGFYDEGLIDKINVVPSIEDVADNEAK